MEFRKMRKSAVTLVWLAGLVVLGLAACSNPEEAEEAKAQAEDRQAEEVIKLRRLCQALRIFSADRNGAYPIDLADPEFRKLLEERGELSNLEFLPQ